MLWHARDMVEIDVCKIHVTFKLDETLERLVEVKDLFFLGFFPFPLFPSKTSSGIQPTTLARPTA